MFKNTCSSCHGSHDIRPKADADSRVASQNIVATCRQCHENANDRFTKYVTHVDRHNIKDYPILHFVWLGMEALILGTMGFFLLHALLWLQRGIIGSH